MTTIYNYEEVAYFKIFMGSIIHIYENFLPCTNLSATQFYSNPQAFTFSEGQAKLILQFYTYLSNNIKLEQENYPMFDNPEQIVDHFKKVLLFDPLLIRHRFEEFCHISSGW